MGLQVFSSSNTVTTNEQVDAKKNVDLPVPFEDLVEKNGVAMLEVIPEDVLPPKDRLSGGDCSLPDARALLHVTSRRKVQHKNAGSPMVRLLLSFVKGTTLPSFFSPLAEIVGRYLMTK